MVQMCVNMFKGGKDACGTVNTHMPVTHKFVISNNIIIIIMKIKPSFKETGLPMLPAMPDFFCVIIQCAGNQSNRRQNKFNRLLT